MPDSFQGFAKTVDRRTWSWWFDDNALTALGEENLAVRRLHRE